MKTMQEVQTLISDLQQFYTDVRLLDAAAIERIEEGVRSNPKAEDLCYACRHRSRRCHHCAVKSAFENHDQRTKLEYFSPDIVQVSAQYMEVDGAPYVLELLQRMQSDTIVEPDDTEALFSALSGYNTKLYHDPLTDMYNRRYYEEIVRGMKGPIGVALMDLDDFKVYNDTYGHHAGDLALETVAKAIRSCIRETDLLIRYGGDEFLLVLPSIPADYFKVKLEQIRTAVQQTVVPGYPHFRLSLSIGGAMQTLADPMENVVRRADFIMYQAKNHKDAVAVDTQDSRLAAQKDVLGEKPVILLVDDSMMNRMMLAGILGDDYRILEAENGKQCLELLRANAGQISLVLLDINMPVMDGYEATKEIRKYSAKVPIIAITAFAYASDEQRVMESGFDGYMPKPINARLLKAQLTEIMQKRIILL